MIFGFILNRSIYYRQAEIKAKGPLQEDCLIEEDKFEIAGRRIVDISHFFQELQNLNNHSPFGCTLADMEIKSENKQGLISGIQIKCKMCKYSKVVWTECPKTSKMNSNTAAVTGITSIGGGFTNMEEFLSILDIPSMSKNKFLKEQEKLTDAWEATALTEMELAASEEKRLAIQRGDVDSEGIPLLTVVVDGSWAKRSYRTNFSSLSGTVSSFTSSFYSSFSYLFVCKISITIFVTYYSTNSPMRTSKIRNFQKFRCFAN